MWTMSEIFKKCLIIWNVDLELKLRKSFLIVDNYSTHPDLDSENSVSQHHIPVTTYGRGNHSMFETL
jgi:hypothetical protein